MFKTSEEVQKFILWAKANKVKAFNGHGIQFEISDIGFVEGLDLNQVTTTEEPILDPQEASIIQENEQAKEDEDLFWSSQNG